MKTKQSKALKKQKIALGICFVIISGVVLYMADILISDIPIEGYVEGKHYHLVDNPRRIRGDKVEIMEFFSYGCIHCYNFDEDLENWVEKNKSRIDFVRTPLISSELWRNYGRTYYAMQKLGILSENHTMLFREIHDVKRNLGTAENLTSYIAANSNLTEEEFSSVFNSTDINQKLGRATQLSRRFKIASVPNMVVNGKYRVQAGGSVGLSRMLDIMDYLIEQETKGAGTESGDQLQGESG